MNTFFRLIFTLVNVQTFKRNQSLSLIYKQNPLYKIENYSQDTLLLLLLLYIIIQITHITRICV